MQSAALSSGGGCQRDRRIQWQARWQGSAAGEAAEAKKAEEAAAAKKAEEAAEEAKKAEEAKAAADAEEAAVAKKVAQSLYTQKHAPADDEMVDAPDTQVDELSAARGAMRAARAAAHALKTKEPAPEPEKKESLGLVYLWSAPLKSWGQMLRAPEKKPKVALLSREQSVLPALEPGTSAHQDVELTADEVAEEKDVDLHISDEFAGMARRDEEALDEQKREDKKDKYDPVAAVKTDMEP